MSGEITVRGHNGKGTLRATNVSGDLRLHGHRPRDGAEHGDRRHERARRTSCEGAHQDHERRLELRAASSTRDVRIDAEAINGDLRFRFRRTLDAEFDIETFNGDIDNCFGPKPHRTREYGPGNEPALQARQRATAASGSRR